MEQEKEMSTSTTNLPQEIHMEILSWFPAESLLTSFKFVCKAWHTLIQDPDFIKMHLKRGAINGGGRISANYNHSLICKSGNKLFQLYPPFNFEGIPTETAKRLDFGFDLSSSSSRLVGSCIGLLCISVNDDDRIVILNPSTRKYKVLPKEPIECPSEFKSWGPATYGFGCCHNSTTAMDEYKVLRIAHFYPIVYEVNNLHNESSFQFQIDIYSMSSNLWRRWRGAKELPYSLSGGAKELPYSLSGYRPTIFVGGALHWTGLYSPGYGYMWDVLLSFDIKDEEFRQLAWPPCNAVDVINEDVILINVKGCLGMIYIHDIGNLYIEIWVMKEYDIRECWTRECVIRYSNSDPPKALSASSLLWISMACFLRGDQILIREGYERLALYDLNTKKIYWDFELVGILAGGTNVELVDYIETLVSLKSSLLLLPPSDNRKRKNCS